MRIMIDIGHPADFLLFREFARQMREQGHELRFCTRRKDVAVDLIEASGFPYDCFGRNYHSIAGKVLGILRFDLQLLRAARRFLPDVFLSAGSIYAAHVSFLMRRPHIVCEDTGNMEQIRLYQPCTSVILTSSSFRRELGPKQVRYEGYHELAYLHPRRFTPEQEKAQALMGPDGDGYVLVRFVSWSASHDYGLKGFSPEQKRSLINELSQCARVYISSEQELPPDLATYRFPLPPADLHHAIAFAALVIGEGATVAAEAAVLGTPAIYINPQSLGYLEEMERYGLVRNYGAYSDRILAEARMMLADGAKRQDVRERRQRMLADKIDVTAFLAWFVEDFPKSLRTMREKPEYHLRFKAPAGH